MRDVLISLLAGLASSLPRRASIQIEILALRRQLGVLQRTERRRLHLGTSDRLLWVALLRFWADWRKALVLVKPETVIGRHRKGFRLYWNWKSRRGRFGRSCIPRDIRELIGRAGSTIAELPLIFADPAGGKPRRSLQQAQAGLSRGFLSPSVL